MHDILEEIVANKLIEVANRKKEYTPSCLYRDVEAILNAGNTELRSMSASLAKSSSGIIAEFKRRSPSKGWIKEDGKPEEIPASYAKNGAAALSILTDREFFGGELAYIEIARPLTNNTPILRKDFIIDEYQLFEAKKAGADAVLLIAADLTTQQCRELALRAHELQLETLLEIHTEKELDYVGENIDMVGVNNRNLGTFHTDVENSYKLAELLPKDYVLVSESGISSPKTVRELRDAGFRGFLIGETFMRTTSPGDALKEFIEQVIS